MEVENTAAFRSWFPIIFGLLNGVVFLFSSPVHLDGLFVVKGWFVVLPLCVVTSAIVFVLAIKWRKKATYKVLANIGIVLLAILLLIEVPLVLIAYA